MTLVDEERGVFYSLPPRGLRRAEWLLGRVAAKEAVRVWGSKIGFDLNSRDIVVAANARGKPIIRCSKIDGIELHLSIAHAGGRATAAVSPNNIGIDYEKRMRQVPIDEFDQQERRLCSDEMLLPFWCAREAAAKASGRGLEGAWMQWRIVEVSEDRQRVVVERSGIRYQVRLVIGHEHVFALCVAP